MQRLSRAFETWVATADDAYKWRGDNFPTECSFLEPKERKVLAAELEADVYPRFCTCNTVLGRTDEEWELIPCEAQGGCAGRRWFHQECGHEPDAETGEFVCPDCVARPRGDAPL